MGKSRGRLSWTSILARRRSTISEPTIHLSILPLVLSNCSAIANQESLSILEVEMRKLEAVVKEIVDELGYLQRREMRMRDTNGEL